VTESESRFWRFSLAVYGDPAVQRECLELQDTYGVDVSLLLFCAFIGAAYGAVFSDRAVKEAADAVRTWQNDVVGMLRAARRALKPFATATSRSGAAAATLRAQVKDIELEAERIEQAMLEHWAAAQIASWPRGRPTVAIAENLRTLFAVTVQGPQPPVPQHLIAAAFAVAGG